MKKLLIKNGRVVFPEEVKKTDLLISGGKIKKLGRVKNYDQAIDAEGLYVLPGFIDLHYHGLFILPSPERIRESLSRMQKMLALRGVAGFLATFPAMPIPALIECLSALKELSASKSACASETKLLGVHLEGPFLNPEAKGAQPEKAIIDYDPNSLEMARLFEVGRGLIKIMTFAPERKGAKELVKVLKAEGIIPALGHSIASIELAEEFAELGACYLTHLFNGMKGIHHREPGLALAGLLDARFFREVIVDGYHLHPEVVRLIWRCSKKDKFILVTDFVGDETPIDSEPPQLPNGNLAGSRLRMIRAIRNLMKFSGAKLSQAVKSASLLPAQVLGLKEMGEIKEGAEANLVMVNENLLLKKVILGGKIIDPEEEV